MLTNFTLLGLELLLTLIVKKPWLVSTLSTTPTLKLKEPSILLAVKILSPTLILDSSGTNLMYELIP